MNKEQLVEKVVKEWSYRCEKGYPDLNNEKDLLILERLFGISLKEQEEEVSEKEELLQNLIKMLSSSEKREKLSLDFLKKLYNTVQNKGEGLGAKIKEILKDKKLLPVQEAVFLAIDNTSSEKEFLQFYNDSSRHVTLDDLKKSDKLFNILKNKTNLPIELFETLYKIINPEKGKGVGKGEVLLVLLGKEGISPSIGDVSIEGKNLEIKADGGRLGEREGNLEQLYVKLQKLVPTQIPKKSLSKFITDLISSNSLKDEKEQQKFLEEVQELLNAEFDGKFTNTTTLTDSLEVQKTLFEWYVDKFLKGDADYADLIGIILKGEIRIYSKEEFKQAVLGNEIKLKNFTPSSKTPQLQNFR